MFLVYQITGPTGKYIGQTKDLPKRLLDHSYRMRKGASTRLHRAMRKYGADCFFTDVLLSSTTHENVLLAEQAIIEQLKASGQPLYNLTDGGEGACGHRHSEESRLKMSLAASKKNRRVVDPKTAQKLSACFKGKPLSAETRAKMSIAARARCADPEVRKRMSEAAKARCATPAGRLHMFNASHSRRLGVPE